MRDMSWSVLLEPAQGIRGHLESVKSGEIPPLYWESLWRIAAHDQAETLQDIARRITDFVLPVLAYTRDQSDQTRQVQQLNPFEILSPSRSLDSIMSGTAASRTAALLKATNIAVKKARSNLQRFQLNAASLENAGPQTDAYMVRSSLWQNIISAIENLNGVKVVAIRARYPDVFRGIDRLVASGQRNVLAHQYGHADATVQWARIWQTVHSGFPVLESAIEKVIADL